MCPSLLLLNIWSKKLIRSLKKFIRNIYYEFEKMPFYLHFFKRYYFNNELRSKIQEIMKYSELDVSLNLEDQEEQALPGFYKYKQTGYHRYMFGRYLYAIPFIRNKIVLDAGSGLGWGSYLICHYSKRLISIDNSSEANAFAIRHWRNGKLDFKKISVCNLTVLNTPFETVLCFELIEHLNFQDGVRFIMQVANSLGKGGYFLISSYFPSSNTVARSEESKNPYHLHIYSKDEIKNILLNNGFKKIKILGELFVVAQK